MHETLTWEGFRQVVALEQISLTRAALICALEVGMWEGVWFAEAELAPFQGKAAWLRTHAMDPQLATGRLKAAYSAYLAALVGEVDTGRTPAIAVRRDLTGAIDPKLTMVPIEAVGTFAEVFGVELGDLWQDYVEDEDNITDACMTAADKARLLLEGGRHLSGAFSHEEYDSLPEWAKLEMRSMAQRVANAPAAPGHASSRSQTPSQREMRTLLNVVGSLIETCLDSSPGGQRYSQFESQAALIDLLIARYPKVAGISKRTLEGLIPKARRSLISEP